MKTLLIVLTTVILGCNVMAQTTPDESFRQIGTPNTNGGNTTNGIPLPNSELNGGTTTKDGSTMPQTGIPNTPIGTRNDKPMQDSVSMYKTESTRTTVGNSNNTGISKTTRSRTTNTRKSYKSSSIDMDHCVMMKDGKMMTKMNGKTMPMKKNMTMTNGTKVMTDGTIKTKSGKTMMMKNGDCMMMNGKMMDCKMPMKKGMKM